MRVTLSILILFSIISCSPKISSSFDARHPPLTVDDKVAFLDIQHEVPAGAKKTGTAKFGDSGFTTDCGFDSHLIKARKIARENGANIVKVVRKKKPDIWSSCYRLKIEFYSYDGNLSALQQYQLQIK